MKPVRYDVYNEEELHLGSIELQEKGWVPLDHSNNILAETDGSYYGAKTIVLSKGIPAKKEIPLSLENFLDEEEESDYDLNIDKQNVDIKKTNMNTENIADVVDTLVSTETKTRKPKNKKIEAEISPIETHDLNPSPDHTETTASSEATEKQVKTPTLTCLVTGKSRQSTNQYLQEKAERLGTSMEDVTAHYICKDAMKLLNAGKSLTEVQEALGITGVEVDAEKLARGIMLNGKKKRTEA